LAGIDEVFVLAAVAGEEVSFFALGGAGELDEAGAVVAEEVEIRAVVEEEDGFRRESGGVEDVGDFGRLGAGIAVPAVEVETGFIVAGAGDEEKAFMAGGIFQAAQAAAVEVPEEGRSKLGGGLLFDDLLEVLEGDDQGLKAAGFGVGDEGVAEADVEGGMVGGGGEGLDVETVFLGGQFFELFFGEVEAVKLGGAVETQRLEGGGLEHGLDEGGAGGAGGSDGPGAVIGLVVGGEETVAVGTGFAVQVAAVGGNPVNPGADAGGAFDIGFGEFFGGAEVRGQVKLGQGEGVVLERVEAEGIVFVVGDQEAVGIEGDGGGGVGGAVEGQDICI